MSCLPKFKHTLIHLWKSNKCRLCVPTSVIPGVPALLCVVTLFIALRQLEIAFPCLLQLFEVKFSFQN